MTARPDVESERWRGCFYFDKVPEIFEMERWERDNVEVECLPDGRTKLFVNPK
jgi:hypothetical protein